MAFDATNFEHIAGNRPGYRLFGYQSTADAVATITAAGYFNNVAGKVAVNDTIIVAGSDSRGIAMVNSNDGTTVDTTDVTAINTDSG